MRTVTELRELVGGAPSSDVKTRDELAAAGLVESGSGTWRAFVLALRPVDWQALAKRPKEKNTYQKMTARPAGAAIVNQPDSSSSRWHSAAARHADTSATATPRASRRGAPRGEATKGVESPRSQSIRLRCRRRSIRTKLTLMIWKATGSAAFLGSRIAMPGVSIGLGRCWAGSLTPPHQTDFRSEIANPTIKNCISVSAEIDCLLQEMTRAKFIFCAPQSGNSVIARKFPAGRTFLHIPTGEDSY
jgi:hypothetical protein